MAGLKSRPRPPSSGNPLGDRFWRKVQDLTNQAGLSIAPGYKADLERFVAQGVARMRREGVIRDEVRIEEAEENLTIFVQQMIDEANQRGVSALHEFTFAAARNSLCPIWPFC
jgi:hypothetical protein